ncbi:MAG: YhgE/Pip family protein [Clostridium sp.]|uniref:YhgE/Pip domain-containing protein n=1 Tax=Clostridium sp. TaxID=1506 RepID=UPI003EE57F44
MKNIFKIFKKDVVKIATNWVALVVVIGLIILPSLYAWFNIKSSWDPYGNTKGIKIAVVNEDKGAEFKGKKINVGEEVVNELKNNNSLGWVFEDKEKAKIAVERGEVFASIEIPENFSKDAISLTSDKIIKPDLIYTVNEGANAIAPKITDKGVQTIKGNVDSSLVKAVNGAIFKAFNEIGIEYVNERPKIQNGVKTLYDLNSNSDKIGELINKAYDGTITVNQMVEKINAIVPSFEETLNKASDILNSSETFLQNSKESIKNISPVIKDDLVLGKKLIDGALEMGNSLNENIDKEAIIQNFTAINGRLQTINGIVSSVKNICTTLNKNGVLDNTIGKLNGLNEKINNTINFIDGLNNIAQGNGAISKEDIATLKEKLSSISNLLGNIVGSYDQTIMPAINSSIDKVLDGANSAEETIQKTKEALPKVKEGLSVFKSGATISNEKLKVLKEDYPQIQKTLSDIVSKIKKIDNGDNVDSVLDLLTNDWKGESDFLGNPVNIQENRLFTVPNYGSAMSPFYTTLAIWVGGLILVSVLTVSIKGIDKEKENIKTYQIFLGKYLTFITIGMLQGFVVAMGDMFILKTYVLNKVGFVLFSMFVSFVFITIIYSIVSVFGNIGKAICIIFLVLQVAAGGGTFPVEVMSNFFKGLNPILPFKYAINGMRYLVAGGVQELFIQDFVILLITIIPFIIIGLLFKKVFNKSSEKFISKLKESDIVEH